MRDNLNRRKKKKITNRFLEHLRGVEKGGKDASKPVARHFNNSTSNMRVFGLSLHQGNTKSRKNSLRKFLSKRRS